jgi:uncharacterized Zn finger protein
LIEQRQTADAERWAKEGIERSLAKLPGISGSLLRLLCEVANRRKRWDIVAAHAAMEFFDRPSRSALEELIARARKANCGEQVRKAALQFLETGTAPFEALPGKGGAQSLRVDSAWPLPLPDYLASLLLGNSRSVRRTGPHYDVLLDMAIAAKRPDDVLHWYDKMKTDQKRPLTTWGRAYFGEGTSDRVAAAVAKSHPERALGIYRRALEAHLPQTGISAYESAASYLKKMRPIMDALGHSGEWSALLAEIRERYRNRPRFMEILDKLEGRTILASRKAGRRR